MIKSICLILLVKRGEKMFKLFRYLKWIDYLYVFLILGLVVLQVWLDLELPNYMANIIKYL